MCVLLAAPGPPPRQQLGAVLPRAAALPGIITELLLNITLNYYYCMITAALPGKS